jgi:hypothetical protein
MHFHIVFTQISILTVDQAVEINAVVKSLKIIIAIHFRSDSCKTLQRQTV